MKIVWTRPENPAHFLHASVGAGGECIASLSRTAQGVILSVFSNGASGEGRNHRVASIAQGKRFLDRWVAAHEGVIASAPAHSRQPMRLSPSTPYGVASIISGFRGQG
jgi:hypothetical protein